MKTFKKKDLARHALQRGASVSFKGGHVLNEDHERVAVAPRVTKKPTPVVAPPAPPPPAPKPPAPVVVTKDDGAAKAVLAMVIEQTKFNELLARQVADGQAPKQFSIDVVERDENQLIKRIVVTPI
jgi:hypothetical protein